MTIYTEIAYTENNLVDIGLTVICNIRDFEQAPEEWKDLAVRKTTWEKSKNTSKNHNNNSKRHADQPCKRRDFIIQII